MLALVAAVLFLLALIFDLANVAVGSVLTVSTLTTAGLLFAALHLAGVGSTWSVKR
ncbi:hypothetical protein [Sinosporangium siamense]|uniref:Uncharacterized protein n=1 Tax=Sinosporangium siamense TaxID=1367973 RepID=A0A919RK91_9ACTN|nr:hypothetical protein [Sinosporangium siamense]GII93914.1 hypothetical protein Ssi02_41450 [Sinosporangium siamense]